MEEIPYICLRNAQIQAYSEPLVDFPNAFCGGIVLESSEHQQFRQHRSNRVADSFRSNQIYNDRLAGDFIYAGPMYMHFGHFMAEMAHRIIPAQLLGLRGRYLFVTTEGNPGYATFEALPAFVREFLEFCGLSRDDIVVINSNTIVERLHLVPQGASLGSYPQPGYLDALATYTAPRLDRVHGNTARPERLYVSRSALPRTGSLLGEACVEKRLEQQGFHVFRPERHRLTEQMDYYRKAKVVVFPSGSACHGAELLGRRMLDEVLLIPRIDNQSGLFQRILKPRAKYFSCTNASIYLGTLMIDRSTGEEARTLGVSVFDLDRLTAGGSKIGFPAFPLPRYAAAAAADMVAYLAKVPGTALDRSRTSRAELFARLAKQMTAMARRRLSGRSPVADSAETRFLTDAEIVELWAATGILPHPHGPFFRMAMLTLQPPGNLIGMRWSELALDRHLWTIPPERTKTGQSRHVPLSRMTCDLLAEMRPPSGSDRIFYAKGRSLSPIADAKQVLDDAIRALKAPAASPEMRQPWSMADLRRTGQQRLKEMGYREVMIRHAIGSRPETHSAEGMLHQHSVSEDDQRYILDKWAGEIQSILSNL